METLDGIVIGAGHNGLICAAYLARAGLKVAVIERNSEIGGGTTTEEVTLPGFRHNLHANYHVGVIDSPWLRDLELHRFGLSYLLPPVQHAMTFPDGTCVVFHRNPEKTAESFARFSKRDAETYRELYEKYAIRMRRFMVSTYFSSPLPFEDIRARTQGPEGDEFLSFADLSMNEAVERTFEDERIQNIFKLMLNACTVENVPGTGSFFPAILSSMSLTGLAAGGSLSLPRALARSVEGDGGMIVRDKTVREIVIQSGEARAVILDDGTRWEVKKFIASAIDAPQTLELTGDEHFPTDVTEKLRGWKWGSHTLCTLHLALSDPPRYASSKFDANIDRAFNIFMGPTTAKEVNQNFAEVQRGDFPTHPMGNGACNSLFDPTYAPNGKHVAFWWPWARFDLKDGGADAWDRIRNEATERLLDAWCGYAPNLTQKNVQATYLFTPLDIARRTLNMVRGGMRVGAYYPDQLGTNRPHPMLSDGRTPVKGLYLCGSSTGHGGGVGGSPGYCAANLIAKDLKLNPWWEEIDPPQWPEEGKTRKTSSQRFAETR